MFYELRKNLKPVLFAGMVLTSCVMGTGTTSPEPVQVYAAQSASDAYPREIDVRQAREELNDGAFFLDVRERSEWEAVRIPGAVLIPLNQLQEGLHEIPLDKDIVIVCASGSRSKEALEILRKAGIEKASSMSGGVRLWKQVGFPIEEGM